METAAPALQALERVARNLKLLGYEVQDMADDWESVDCQAAALTVVTVRRCLSELENIQLIVTALVTQANPAPPPIIALLEQDETKEGLVSWLESEEKARGLELVADLSRQIGANDRLAARATFEKLLRTILTGLDSSRSVQSEIRDDAKLHKLVDNLRTAVETSIHQLEDPQMAKRGHVTTEDVDAVKKDWDRLRRALRTIKLLGKRLGNQNGELDYLKQQELVGALAVMAQTLPTMHFVHELCTVPQADELDVVHPVSLPQPPNDPSQLLSAWLPTAPSSRDTHIEAYESRDEKEMAVAMAQSPVIPKYQRRLKDLGYRNLSLVSSIAAKLGDAGHTYHFRVQGIIECLQVDPKAWLCSQGTKCPGKSDGSCAESHGTMEVMSHLPLYKLLPCPLSSHRDVKPKSLSKQIEISRCVFHHGASPVRINWINDKVDLCEDRLECGNVRCYRSHSLQEVCWFNPHFCTINCLNGAECLHYRTCDRAHPGQTKRHRLMGFANANIKASFLERTHAELAAYLEAEEVRLKAVQPNIFAQRVRDLGYLEAIDDLDNDDETYRLQLKVMIERLEADPKAWLCNLGPKRQGHSVDKCPESHERLEMMTHLPLYKLLPCPLPNHCVESADPLTLAKCMFRHGQVNMPTDWMVTKKRMCLRRWLCTDAQCFKSHSLQEICWYNPLFRTQDCPEGDDCDDMINCWWAHPEQPKREPMDGFMDAIDTPLPFIERTHRRLASRLDLTLKVLTVAPSANEYARRIQELGYTDGDVTEAIAQLPKKEGPIYKAMFAGIVETLETNPAAWMCNLGPQCPDIINGSCAESHTVLEVMARLPLYKLLPCRVRSHMTSNDPLLRARCVFDHGDLNTSITWLKTKKGLCWRHASCDDESCRNSHSLRELCWYAPLYRTEDCKRGADCPKSKRRWCHGAHNERQKRLPTDGLASSTLKTLFLERTHAHLAQQLEAIDPRFQVTDPTEVPQYLI